MLTTSNEPDFIGFQIEHKTFQWQGEPLLRVGLSNRDFPSADICYLALFTITSAKSRILDIQ